LVKNNSTRVELMAIPIVAVLFGIGLVLFVASVRGVWAWLFVGVAGVLLVALLVARLAKRNPHPVSTMPAPPVAVATPEQAGANGPYRILVIADESCVGPAFSSELAAHAGGRSIEALVIAPAIGSRLSRWTGDESQFADARTHLDETVAALAGAGISARGETGADDPLQAADDGLREFPAHEVVFVTKSGTDTDWVEQGVVEAAKKRYQLPVTHIALDAS
jgi:hypothetical protein